MHGDLIRPQSDTPHDFGANDGFPILSDELKGLAAKEGEKVSGDIQTENHLEQTTPDRGGWARVFALDPAFSHLQRKK